MVSKTVGFVGVGNMGKPMAVNLLKRGCDLTVCDIRPGPVQELKTLGAKVAASCTELARASDFIITMVRDIVQTNEVIFGKAGLWDGLKPGTTLIIMSTIDPQFVRKLSRQAQAKSVAVLDAPVSGGLFGAEKATISIMIGGKEKLFEECRPLFEAMGKNIFYVGAVGNGMVLKLINNLMRQITLFGTREALKLARKAGLSAERLFEVVNISSGRSWATENWERDERQIEKYRQNPNSSDFVNLDKDRQTILDFAKSLDVNLPLLAFLSQLDIE